VGPGEPSLYGKEAAEIPAKIRWRLHIAVRPVDIPVSMVKILVGDDEFAAVLQHRCDLGELLRLVFAEVLEQALRYDEIEFHCAEVDPRLQYVDLEKILRWLWD
jgi:hypothetical protein